MGLETAALLKEWGVTIGLVAAAGTALLMLMILSLREFFAWFLRLNQMVNTQKEILRQLEDLKKPGPSAAVAANMLAAGSSPKFPLSEGAPKSQPFSLEQ